MDIRSKILFYGDALAEKMYLHKDYRKLSFLCRIVYICIINVNYNLMCFCLEQAL